MVLELKHKFYLPPGSNRTSTESASSVIGSHLPDYSEKKENYSFSEIEEPSSDFMATYSNSTVTSVSCQTQVFFHLFVICERSWSIAAFILLHHIHDGIIPVSTLVRFFCEKSKISFSKGRKTAKELKVRKK